MILIGMTPKKITYNPKTRKSISNPYSDVPYDKLLKQANITTFNGNFEIEQLPNGRIKVHKKNSKNK